jgi:hypothetical protein
MLVRDLIEELEQFDPDTEVRIAQQPSWPFEYGIDAIIEVDTKSDHCTECGYEWPVHAEKGCDETEPADPETPTVVYIVEGDQLAYLPGVASEAIGWK